ncbi:hypothetical protein KR093_010951, partial [Drosophila rubida]
AKEVFNIEGIVLPAAVELQADEKWPIDIRIAVNGGEYLGFVRENGSFMVSGVPPGSHILESYHSDIYIPPLRVDISSRGKFRARKLSHIRPKQIIKLPYPLFLKPLKRRKYFRVREEWNIMDYVLNPMVLLMVVPLLLMLILPRLISDPETKREIENIQIPRIPSGVPDFSDMLTSFLAGKRQGELQQKASPKNAKAKR